MGHRLSSRFKASVAIILAVATVAWLGASVFADFSDQEWRFFKSIRIPDQVSEESLIEMVPDAEVFENAAPGLTDLRVIEGDTQIEVPYKLVVERGDHRRNALPLSLRDLGHVADEYTTFVADTGQEGALHNELEIRTPSRNFQRGVVLEASSDGITWAVIQESQIFDFTITERGFTERLARVQYPSSTARYLRVRIINDSEPPLEVTGALAYFAQTLPPLEQEVSTTLVGREEDGEQRSSILLVDLGSTGLPTSRLSIATTQENFYRVMSLQGRNDAETWTHVLSSQGLYVYNTPKFVGSKLSLNYPESTYRYYRITILNEDDPVLPVSSVSAHGVVRKLIFSASPNSAYALYYGNPEARTPSYELERIFPYLVTENLPEAQLGAQTANPAFTGPPEPTKPFTERYPWLLPTIVAVAALLVGLFLASLLRQIRHLLPPPSAQ